ncbi:MAG: GldG family protein [Alphaproteobacteria bacterium]
MADSKTANPDSPEKPSAPQTGGAGTPPAKAETGLAGHRTIAIASLILLAVLLVAVNALSGRLSRGTALDFTEDNLFTLSDSTRTVLTSIDEPITLKLYYSRKLGEAAPTFIPYITRVRELLQRYQGISGGKIRLEILNPEPFSTTEDEAVRAGLQAVPLSSRSDEKGYFGLVGTNSTDDELTIAFFHPNRESFLEYDVTRLVERLANPKKKVVGLMSNLRLSHPAARRGMWGTPWVLLSQLSERFTMRQVSSAAKAIDKDIDVLLVVHPKKPSPQTLYAIDQFIMRGGKAIFFIDPHAETDRAGGRFGIPNLDTGSSLPKVMEPWGIKVLPNKVVGDPSRAVRVQFPSPDGRGRQVVEHLAWMALTARNMNREDIVTAELRQLYVASPGAIVRDEKTKSKVTMTPLLISTPQAELIDANKLRFRPNLPKLVADYKAGGRVLVLAARLRGPAESAFPKGPPPEKPKKGDKKKKDDKAKAKAKPKAKPAEKKKPKPKHLTKSVGPINVIVIADTDLMDDKFWISRQSVYGRQVPVAAADNGAFIINAVDNMAGGKGLIGLRSRGQAARPFTLVQEIQRKASVRLRAKEQGLVKKLAETRKKLTQLQSKTDKAGETILSAAQIKAIDQFRVEIIKTRGELRAVQHAMRSDIDRLERRIQFYTIAAVPLAIAIFAAIMGLVRRRRRRRRHAMAEG